MKSVNQLNNILVKNTELQLLNKLTNTILTRSPQDLEYLEQSFNWLFGHINGKEISKIAKAEHAGSEPFKEVILYGELPFQTWIEIVEQAQPKKDGVFFDLGSGTGRIIMQSHLIFDFKKIIGIELLEPLHTKACQIRKDFEEQIKIQIPDFIKDRELHLIQQDFFNSDLREADFIFMNHPFKDRGSFEPLEAKFLNELKPGTKIVTIIRKLNHPAFKHLHSQKYNFSWGEASTHFHEV
jgi:precorrin-6B methylase 2